MASSNVINVLIFYEGNVKLNLSVDLLKKSLPNTEKWHA